MLYDKLGRLITSHYPEKHQASVKIDAKAGKAPMLRVSPRLIGGYESHSYELIIGRGKHSDWIGLWFDKKKTKLIDGKFIMKPFWCSTTLKAYRSIRDQTFEDLKYVITSQVFYVELPHRKGLQEQDSWWMALPDVSDNPADRRAEVRDMHGMWGDGRTPDDDGGTLH